MTIVIGSNSQTVLTDKQQDKPVGNVARYAASLATANLSSALATAVLQAAAIDRQTDAKTQAGTDTVPEN